MLGEDFVLALASLEACVQLSSCCCSVELKNSSRVMFSSLLVYRTMPWSPVA